MKNICKICISLLLSVIMVLGGTNWSSGAVDIISPTQIVPIVTVDVSTTKTTIEQGDTQTLKFVVAPSGGTKSFSSSNSSVATVDQYGVVTAVNVGTATITARYTYSGTVYTDTVSITVVPKSTIIGIQNGTNYYIMNYSGKRLMGLATASDSNLTNVNTGERAANTRYQWVTEQQTDGTFQLISAYSSAGRCLDVTGSNVDIYADSGASYQKFTIERVTSKPYEGLYLIKYGEKFVSQESNYDVRLTETQTASCYWSFMAVQKGYAEFFCLDCTIDGVLTQSDEHYMYFREACNSAGYFSWSYKNNSAAAAYNCIKSRDDIFVFAGHGGAGMISFNNDDGEDSGIISATTWLGNREKDRHISSIQANGLNHARVVLYVGCGTGETWEKNAVARYNLVDETFEKGAHFVLGIQGTIYQSQLEGLIKYFLDGVSQGNSVANCIPSISDINDDLRIGSNNDLAFGTGNSNGFSIYTRGDDSQYLAIT